MKLNNILILSYKMVPVKKRLPKNIFIGDRYFLITNNGKVVGFLAWKNKSKKIKAFYTTNSDSSWKEIEGVMYWLEPYDDVEVKELNPYGLLVFKHKSKPNFFLRRAYRWQDRALILENNNVKNDLKFSEVNLDDWIPLTKKEYERMK